MTDEQFKVILKFLNEFNNRQKHIEEIIEQMWGRMQ